VYTKEQAASGPDYTALLPCENLKFSTHRHDGNKSRHTGYLLRTENLSSAGLPTKGMTCSSFEIGDFICRALLNFGVVICSLFCFMVVSWLLLSIDFCCLEYGRDLVSYDYGCY
jgi:hypothetical protein